MGQTNNYNDQESDNKWVHNFAGTWAFSFLWTEKEIKTSSIVSIDWWNLQQKSFREECLLYVIIEYLLIFPLIKGKQSWNLFILKCLLFFFITKVEVVLDKKLKCFRTDRYKNLEKNHLKWPHTSAENISFQKAKIILFSYRITGIFYVLLNFTNF